MITTSSDNGIYYFIGNITSHILHALPLHKKLGGTFVVLSRKAKREIEQRYGVPVIALDNRPYQWQRFGWRLKPIGHYLQISPALHKTTDYLNEHAKVVLFYELYDFAESVRLTKPRTVFLTHGNMLKDYMANDNRLAILEQYDYMAALGPYLKQKFIEQDGIPATKLVDLGIARTDKIYELRSQKPEIEILRQLGLDPAKPIIAYLPTFWGASSVYHTGLDIVRHVPDDYSLIIRPHPQTPKRLLYRYERLGRQKPNVIVAQEGKIKLLGLLDLYAMSTAIIGDVSSVMLEAILLNKPLLFAYDRADHSQPSKDYEAIKEVVGLSKKITPENVAELSAILRTALAQGIRNDSWERTKDKIFFHHDGTSVQAIIEFIDDLCLTKAT